MMKFICGTLFNVLMGVILAYVVGVNPAYGAATGAVVPAVLGNFMPAGSVFEGVYTGSDSSGIAFESYPEKGSQEKSTASDLYAEFYFGDCALRYDPYAFITGRPYEQTAWNQYQLDDHAICIPYYLYCKRNLAGSRMGIDHVYGSIIEYKQRSRRSGTDGRCKPSAADLVCTASGY